MLAHPALDHRGDRLHRALDVDFALSIARRDDSFGEFAPEAVAVCQPYQTNAVDWAFRMSRQQCDQRIGKAAPAEESHLGASNVMLIGQHADMDSSFQPPR